MAKDLRKEVADKVEKKGGADKFIDSAIDRAKIRRRSAVLKEIEKDTRK